MYLRYEVTSQLYRGTSEHLHGEKSGFLTPVSLVSLGFLSEAIEQLQNCSKLPQAAASFQGECKSNELNLSSLAHEVFIN